MFLVLRLVRFFSSLLLLSLVIFWLLVLLCFLYAFLRNDFFAVWQRQRQRRKMFHVKQLEVFFMIYGVFGLPRAGKTTYLCKIAKNNIKKGIKVYSNFPLLGAYKLDFSTLGKYDYHDCIMLIDEISLVCDSRDWKNFNSDLRYFFTNHGHHGIDIYYCSQWFTDTDVKIRRMTEELYYIEKFVFGLSKRYTVERDITTSESGEVVDKYSFKHAHLFFRPRYYKMFDSFSVRKLPPLPTEELWTEV